ncbi:VIT1/CCC1 transporter family protein [Corynebacterium freiburgense]|uniref:VIT1/CCC1 transporter family protein n=1 Tax=Corynebacterium freiburgense TaxID=556548 RepID=UPI0003F92FCD|nr:VIT family protein [Corynebacterium freiburgense]WJZ03598.1 VIT family protein [Corynebacterium freiburgense]
MNGDSQTLNSKLNWLRAGVLGANDGIVSTAGLVIGVAATGASSSVIATAGFAALVSGAVSMALGEYVSVSAQRDTERALVEKERWDLEHTPEAERLELVGILQGKGLSMETAERAVVELTEEDPLSAHLDIELGIDSKELTDPRLAAISSAISFVLGALLPLVAVLIAPNDWRVSITLVATLVSLGITGSVSAWLADAHHGRSVARLIIGGAVALGVTYVIGVVFGVAFGA